jgi:hypothetical protein
VLVVVLAERVELVLQLGDVAGGWPGGEPALQVVEAFGLALGLRVPRGSVLLANPEQRQDVFERVAPAGEPRGVDAAVIGQGRGWSAVLIHHIKEHGDDVIAGDRLMSGAGQQEAGVVIEPVQDLDINAIGQAPVDEVRLPLSFGWAAWNRKYEERGRLRGSGVINPSWCRIRRIVEVEGARSPACSRCQAIVTGPASSPSAPSWPRSDDPLTDLLRGLGRVRSRPP